MIPTSYNLAYKIICLSVDWMLLTTKKKKKKEENSTVFLHLPLPKKNLLFFYVKASIKKNGMMLIFANQ